MEYAVLRSPVPEWNRRQGGVGCIHAGLYLVNGNPALGFGNSSHHVVLVRSESTACAGKIDGMKVATGFAAPPAIGLVNGATSEGFQFSILKEKKS